MAKDNSELIDVNSDENDRVREASHIQSLIYVIRGKQVMLDSDLAISVSYTHLTLPTT